MKIVVTGTRGIPNVMGGVETRRAGAWVTYTMPTL